MKLTKREREILPLLCLSNKQICNRLHITDGTVKTHIYNIISKFPEQANRSSIVLEAVKCGIIKIDEVVTS